MSKSFSSAPKVRIRATPSARRLVLRAIARAMTISGFVGFTVKAAMTLPTADAAHGPTSS
jgi:hypothetical protein